MSLNDVAVANPPTQLKLTEDDYKIQTPSKMVVIGQSMSGKTTLMIRILKNLSTVYDGEFDEIVFVAKPEAFKMKEDLFVDLKKSVPKIQFHEGMPKNIKDLFSELHKSCRKLCVLDDLGFILNDKRSGFEEFFTTDSHLYNISLIYSIQNYYSENKSMTITRNTTERIIFPTKSETRALRTMSADIFPGYSNFIIDALNYVQDHYNERYVLICSNPLSKMPRDLQMKALLFRYRNNKYCPLWLKPIAPKK